VLQDARVPVQGLDDGQPHRAQILEHPLRGRFATGGIFTKLADELLEALIGPPAIGLEPPLIGLQPPAIGLGLPAIGPRPAGGRPRPAGGRPLLVAGRLGVRRASRPAGRAALPARGGCPRLRSLRSCGAPRREAIARSNDRQRRAARRAAARARCPSASRRGARGCPASDICRASGARGRRGSRAACLDHRVDLVHELHAVAAVSVLRIVAQFGPTADRHERRPHLDRRAMDEHLVVRAERAAAIDAGRCRGRRLVTLPLARLSALTRLAQVNPEALVLRVRFGAAEALHRGQDEPRVERVQRVPAEAEPVELGPASYWVRSSTRIPPSALLMMSSSPGARVTSLR
jgi:hypothetical protein